MAQVKAGRELLESEEKRKASELRTRMNGGMAGSGSTSGRSSGSSMLGSSPAARNARPVRFDVRRF